MHTFQVLSDVCLDERGSMDFPAVADHLVLAGGIGDPECPLYAAFLRRHAHRFVTVIVVAGEREFRGCGGNTVRRTQQIRDVCASIDPGNVVFLNRAVHHLADDLALVGCTLWSRAPPLGDAVGWTDRDRNFMRRFESVYVRKCVEEARAAGTRVVLVTHHPPPQALTRSPVVLAIHGSPATEEPELPSECVAHSNPLDAGYDPQASVRVP
jgi:hypothetical protein